MSIGIFSGTIKTIERRYIDEEDFLCTVWLTIADFGEQCLRATARNETAHQMDQLNEGDFVTVSGVVDLESISQGGAKKEVLSIPTILQVNRISQLVLIGRAGSDPTVKPIQNKETGEPGLIAKFNLAVKPPRKTEEPNWYPLEFWGRNAEIVGAYVKQGSLIEIVGTVRMETWQDRQNGDDRARPVVRVDRLQLLASKRTETEQNSSEAVHPTERVVSEEAQPTPPTDPKSKRQTVKRRESSASRKPKKSNPSDLESTAQIPT